jgi:transposase-like protein
MSVLSAPYFHNEDAAYEFLEAIIWAKGVVCPKCGNIGESYKINGKSARPGLRCCKACRKQFRVTVNTVFESSHIALHKWLQAAYLMASSKKGISAHQLHRTLGITYKSAWFMEHRLREAMAPHDGLPPLGGEGKTVEADETYVGGKEKNKHAKDRKHLGRGPVGKESVFSLVERGGKVRSHHVQHVTAETLRPILNEQLHASTRFMTDEARVYGPLGKDFAEHHAVNHSIGEYVRGDAHTNTIEGYFSIFKRGMTGVYQHCSADHLKRYLAEFDFRYNERKVTDSERTTAVLKGIQGKRLTYRDSRKAA